MIQRYWRFIAFVTVGTTAAALMWQHVDPAPAVLIGFDAGAVVFLASLVSLVNGATAEAMRQRSQANEPDHHWLLIFAAGITAITITAVWLELVAMKSANSGERGAMTALATLSLSLIWLFTNALGAMHYAHLWYLPGADGKDARGLDFPATDRGAETGPDYLDFAYFAAVISMTFQVSDVTIISKPLRRLVLVHSLTAFLFNIGVIALSVSLVTSALGN